VAALAEDGSVTAADASATSIGAGAGTVSEVVGVAGVAAISAVFSSGFGVTTGALVSGTGTDVAISTGFSSCFVGTGEGALGAELMIAEEGSDGASFAVTAT